jgi:predicted nucleic acid-binding protein
MGAYYLDSSALVKRYVRETGTEWVVQLAAPQSGHEIFTALVSGVEIVAALTRQARASRLSLPDATAAIAAFKNHLATRYRVVLTIPAVVHLAMHLAESHGLRGYDAIQLASALTVQQELLVHGIAPLTFVCADSELNTAARAEGLMVIDSNQYLHGSPHDLAP